MNGTILFVDDEPLVLEGYRRTLRGDFQVDTADSGEAGVAAVRKNRYAVVVSDMRMPGMDGLEFLSRVRETSSQTVRVVLTGHADLQTAIDALNDDVVFRFLTKPCAPTMLKKTLTASLLQHHLITAEQDLLENTLMGSIKVLTDLLSLISPAAFGRSLRINHCVQHMVRELQLEVPWRYEAAAMLSQLGCITFEPELLEAAYSGKTLPVGEQEHFDMHPAVARNLLANIPRLEGIAWIVGQQLGAASTDESVSDSIKTGAVILQVAIAFDQLKEQGLSDLQAIAQLRSSNKFDAAIVRALETPPPQWPSTESRTVAIGALQPGMLLQEELRSNAGLLLAAKGQEVTYPLVVRLTNLHRRRAVKNEVTVLAAKMRNQKDDPTIAGATAAKVQRATS